MMRRVFGVAAGIVLTAAGAAWASSSKPHSVNVNVYEPLTINGKTIPEGDYKFSWMGTTSTVDVTVKKGNKVVAESKATVEQRAKKFPEESILSKKNASGQQVLEQLRLGGQKTVLVFPAA